MKLSIRQAQALIRAGEDKAAEIGVPVNIAILDAGTQLKAFSRMDGAVLGSIDVALRKAKTAVLFETDSENVWDYCKPGAPAEGLQLTNGGLVTFAGGVLLRAPDGEMLGAVGVSGAAVFQDLEIARAAVAALTF